VGDAARNNYGVWVEAAPGRYSVCSAQPSISYPFGCGYTDVVAGQTSEYRLYYGNGPSSPAGLGHSRVSAQLGETGSLRVTTDPPVGSMITVDGKERNNWGLDWLTLPVGSHDVCFGPVPGKIAPACTTVQVTAGDTADVVGQYVAMGHLRVTTSPQVPSAILVDGAVANVFGVWTPKTVGPHQVCFQPVPGYATPACRTVDVTADGTATTTGTFTPVP